MIVRLPREITGRELIKVIQGAAEALKSDGYVVESIVEERYEFGPVERLLDNAQVSICKLKKVFLRKRQIPGYPRFVFPVLYSDKRYSELEVSMIKGFGIFALPPPYHLCGKDLENVRPSFDKLVAGIYQRLVPVEANT